MPILMPTADELQRIPRHKRERIQRAIVNILTGVGDLADEHAQQIHQRRQFGDLVIRDARILEQSEPRDSPTDIAQRRIELLAAVSTPVQTPVHRKRIVREANAIPIISSISPRIPAATSDTHRIL